VFQEWYLVTSSQSVSASISAYLVIANGEMPRSTWPFRLPGRFDCAETGLVDDPHLGLISYLQIFANLEALFKPIFSFSLRRLNYNLCRGISTPAVGANATLDHVDLSM
jgi:hypothetical protein